MKTFSNNDAWNAEMDALEANWNKKKEEAKAEYRELRMALNSGAGRQTVLPFFVDTRHRDAENFYASLLRTAAES